MFSGHKHLTGQMEPYGGLTSAHGPHFVQPCSRAYTLWATQCGSSFVIRGGGILWGWRVIKRTLKWR